jgi:hypothetical protein
MRLLTVGGGGGKENVVVRPDQSVFEMAEEILVHQAKAFVARTGQPFDRALEDVAKTAAGQQLKAPASGEARDQRVGEWQASLPWKRAEVRQYSWLESFMEWLESRRPARSTMHSCRRNLL